MKIFKCTVACDVQTVLTCISTVMLALSKYTLINANFFWETTIIVKVGLSGKHQIERLAAFELVATMKNVYHGLQHIQLLFKVSTVSTL